MDDLEFDDPDKQPPSSLDLEHQIIGAILRFGDSIVRVIDTITPDDFYYTYNERIYSVCIELFRANEPIDIISVSEVLNEKGLLEDIGGRARIANLAIEAMTSSTLEWCAKKLKDLSVARQVLFASYYAIEDVYSLTGHECLLKAQKALLDIAERGEIRKAREIPEIVDQTLREISAKRDGQLIGIPTGFHALDQMLGGLIKTNLIILAARSSQGKTSMAVNLANQVLISGRSVLFISIESGDQSIMQRMLLSASQNGYQNELQEIGNRLKILPLAILDKPYQDVVGIRAAVMRHRAKWGSLELLVIDYLQLIRAEGRSRHEELSAITKALKAIAREFEITIICLSQLNRKVEERQNKRPILSDLRESGSIEEDADQVVFIYRDEYYHKDTQSPGVAEIIIAKNRDGPTGMVELLFRPTLFKFINPKGVSIW